MDNNNDNDIDVVLVAIGAIAGIFYITMIMNCLS